MGLRLGRKVTGEGRAEIGQRVGNWGRPGRGGRGVKLSRAESTAIYVAEERNDPGVSGPPLRGRCRTGCKKRKLRQEETEVAVLREGTARNSVCEWGEQQGCLDLKLPPGHAPSSLGPVQDTYSILKVRMGE